MNGFSPRCTLMCSVMDDFPFSLAPHSSHSNLPSGSCTAMCFFSCVLMPKCFPQIWHLYLSVKWTEYLCLEK